MHSHPYIQTIPATPDSLAFGYTISGGLDIDDNGYPDITISDLSGSHVTSFRAAPLVNVTLSFSNEKRVLDLVGDADRLCPFSENVKLQCFNVTPCFSFESKYGNVTQFGEYNYNLHTTFSADGRYTNHIHKNKHEHNQITRMFGKISKS